MRHHFLAGCALALALPAVAHAGDAPGLSDSANRFRATVEFLADDALEGREAGKRGFDLAALYVASEMKALGILPGDRDGDFMQDIAFANYQVDATKPMALVIDGQRFAHGSDLGIGRVPGFQGTVSAPAEAVFVGHGLYAPEYGLDAYKGVDVRGKVVVIAGGLDPKAAAAIPSDVRATLMSAAGQMAADKGAVGTISVVPPMILKQVPWETIAGQSLRPNLVSLNPDGSPNVSSGGIRTSAVVRDTLLPKLFAKSPVPLAKVMADVMAGKPVAAFPLGVKVSMERTLNKLDGFRSANVVGMIPGTDPKLKDEVVLLSAHLDHVGVRDGDGHGGGQKPSKDKAADAKDRIYNGAMDNATGVASLLEVARMFKDSGKAPRRTVMLVALTAEEKGLMGSEWLAKNPQMLGNRKLVANVNLDMPVLVGDFDRVVAYGAEHSTMGKVVEQAIGAIGVKRIEDPMPEEVFFVRSDHYSFVKAGVPAVYLDPYPVKAKEARMKDFLDNHYHQASDETNLIDWAAGAKFAKVNYNISRTIADADTAPMWYSDSYFGKKFAPTAAKAKR